MSRNSKSRTKASTKNLDPLAKETLQLVIHTFLRCGYPSDAITECIAAEASRAPTTEFGGADLNSWVDSNDWTQIATLWSRQSEYVDHNGIPRPLRIWGKAPSIEAMVHEMQTTLSVEEICAHMLKAGVARRTSELMIATSEYPQVVHPLGSREQSAHHMNVLHCLMKNFEHNAHQSGSSLRWIERRAVAHQFPESAVETYNLNVEKRVTAFLQQEDAAMDNIATADTSAGKRIRMYAHVFLSSPEYRSTPPVLAHVPVDGLDPLAIETLQLAIRTFLRWGYSPEAIVQGVIAESRHLPAIDADIARPGHWIDAEDWHRVVTLWSRQPQYVDEVGNPRPLPIWGAAPSIEALVREVKTTLSIREVCDGMLKAGAAKRLGQLMVAEGIYPQFLYPPGALELGAHRLRVLHCLVKNFEHNTRQSSGSLRWIERCAIAQQFPEAAVEAYNLGAEKRVTAFLRQEDAIMDGIASSNSVTERTVRMHVHVFLSAPGHRDRGARHSQAASFH